MASISKEELQHYRAQLSEYPDAGAKKALDTVEKYNGDLNAAFAELSEQDGETQFRAVDLEELAIRCRETVCSQPAEDFLGLLNLVAGFLPPPISLAVPVTLYILKIGIRNYCQSPKPA
ncbi:hypothetical protein NIES4071_45130 [Calothrix sp. NIES-4071]|nr:hypothetical protein NIES4071_45130 [Calothrix sp. NIES-4071]BAZ58826.1 hypothetical protein NIES4105_45060 [Calothrix sp. NIES-4105]